MHHFEYDEDLDTSLTSSDLEFLEEPVAELRY